MIKLKRKEYRLDRGHDYAGKDVATQKQIYTDVMQITDVLRVQFIAFVALFLGNVLEKEKGEWAAQLQEVWSNQPKNQATAFVQGRQ